MTRPVPLLLAALALAVPLSLLAGQVWINPLDPNLPGAIPILFELRAPALCSRWSSALDLALAAQRCRAICAIR